MAACADYLLSPAATQRQVRAIKLSATQLALDDGDSAALVATLLDQSGKAFDTVPAGAQVGWSSSADTIASVSGAGVVGARHPGAATVTAAVSVAGGPVGVSVPVTVRPVPKTLALAAGDSQAGPVAQRFPQDLRVRVTDRWSLPVPGVQVDFTIASGRGTLTAASATTDSTGQAGAGLTADTLAGSVAVEARTTRLPQAVVRITATARAGAPATIAKAGGDAQSAIVGTALPQPLVVRVLDRYGNPVAGVAVTWQAASGGGALSPATAATDSLGRASATWTLGAAEGAQQASAAVGTSLTAGFAATGRAVPVATVTVAPDTATLAAGAMRQYAATPKDSTGNTLAGRAVTWTSSDTTIAAVDTTGMVRAAKVGTATITATAGGRAGTARVTVVPGAAAALAFTAQPPAGQAQRVLAPAVAVTVYDAIGNVVTAGTTVTVALGANPGSASLGGTLSQATVAGVATFADLTVSAAGAGYTLVASSTGLTSATSAAFTVTSAAIASVTVAPDTATLAAGATRQYAATLKDSAGNTLTGRAVTWTSSDTTVAAVDTTGMVRVAKIGTATITATAGGIAGTARVTVVPGAAAALAFTAQPPAGQAQQVLAPAVAVTVYDGFGNVVTTGSRTVTVALGANPGSATLGGTLSQATAAGVATFADLTVSAAGVGYTLVASSTGLTSATSAAFTVTVPPVASVTVSPATSSLGVGGTQQLTAVTKDGSGNVLTGRVVTWGSSNQTIATVDATGLVTGVAAGTVTITATSEGVNGTASVTVTAPIALTGPGLVSAGYQHTCDVRPDLTLNCWGFGGSGRLGTGSTSQQTSPALVSTTVQFTQVAAGYDHTCGLAADSTAYCWGHGFQGQIGNGGTSDAMTPSPVSSALHFKRIVSGFENSCALTAAGAVWCWGHDGGGDRLLPAQLNLPPLVTISEFWYHVCGLTASGQAYCWGNDGNGQVGDGLSPHGWTPASTADSVVGGLTFVSIAAGATHSCGATASGVVYCWGDNSSYQAGISSTSSSNPTPQPLQWGGTHTFSTVYAGFDHSCALTAAGVGYCWGTGTYGQLGNGDRVSGTSVVPVLGGLTFEELSTGNQYSCGRTLDGHVYCWGLNNLGQLGVGSTVTDYTLGPQLVH